MWNRILFPVFRLCSIAMVLVAVAGAQTSIELHRSTVRADVKLVLVPVIVTDVAHRPILDLERDAFTVLEDNQPQDLRYFYTEETPVSVALVIDVSGSMSMKMDLLHEAIDRFFEEANPRDEYFLIAFSGKPELRLGPTHSVDDIKTSLMNVQAHGGTALLDGVNLAVKTLRKAHYPRRAVVLISDGGENSSRIREKKMRKILEEADVEAYAIGVFDEPLGILRTLDRFQGMGVMNPLTSATGGHAVAVNRMSELPEAAANISREIRSQYVLGYRPKDGPDNQWRKLKVQVKPKIAGEKLQAYYKTKYFKAPIERASFETTGP